MKKIIIYIGVLVVGLLLGRVLFGSSSNKEATESHQGEVTASHQMWICSMHPQIMQPEPGDCPICGMELIPAEADADGLSPNQFKLTENAMALANIQTTVVGEGLHASGTVKLSGRIAENEEANTVQVSYFSGRIERLHINATGEEVRKGQLLASIYSPELYAAQQELITAASLRTAQPDLYQAVRNKLKLWKLSESQINQIEETGKIKEKFPVYATVSGTVTKKLVEQGDYVKQGQAILKIANLNTVWANFDMYENQIGQFNKGQQVVITSNAYPGKTFNGTVDFIDPVLNTKTRTVTLRVVIGNPKGLFKPGMFVEAKIESQSVQEDSVLTIPASAILWTGERSVVYLKTNSEAPVFEMREVVLGKQLGEQYEVLDGLFVGNEIVTNGTFTVDAAAQLQGKKSMMNKDGGKAMTGHEGHLNMNSPVSAKGEGVNREEQFQVSKTFQQQLKKVYNNYIDIKDALVTSSSTKASEAAKRLLKSLEQVDMKLLSDFKGHTHWMTSEKTIKSTATSISNTSDIKMQRHHFILLSMHFIKAVKAFGINEKVYVGFCPMANDNQGAYWLSKEEKIRNPYFGEAMPMCGEVKQIIE